MRSLLDIALPCRCAICSEPGDGLCPGCLESLPVSPALAPPRGLDDLVALWSYDGPTKALVRAFKYRNHRDAIVTVASSLAALAAHEVDAVVTWAPTTVARRRSRGFDQSELLAREVARAGSRPVRRLLAREPGSPQTGLDRDDRHLGPRFVARRRSPPRVILIDDVTTTGATLSAAARELRWAGAERVVGLTVAVTE